MYFLLFYSNGGGLTFAATGRNFIIFSIRLMDISYRKLKLGLVVGYQTFRKKNVEDLLYSFIGAFRNQDYLTMKNISISSK